MRLSKTIKEFRAFIENYQIPFVGTYLAADFVPSDHPLFMGTIGVKGTRSGNFAMQNTDLLIVLGSRLSISCTGYAYDEFAREAKTVVVDIDKEEHQKGTVNIDLMIHTHLKTFFEQLPLLNLLDRTNWFDFCQKWKSNYPVVTNDYYESEKINQYLFTQRYLKKWHQMQLLFLMQVQHIMYVLKQ